MSSKKKQDSRPGRNPVKTQSKKAQKAAGNKQEQSAHSASPQTPQKFAANKAPAKKKQKHSLIQLNTNIPSLDCGAYLLGRQYQDSFPTFLKRADRAGVAAMIILSSSFELNTKAVAVAKENPGVVYSTVGFHPHDVGKAKIKPDNALMEQLWYQQDVVAVGPLGFDLESKFSTQLSIQQEWFQSQCQFAFDHSAPIILMEYGAHQALLDAWTDLITQNRPAERTDIDPFEAAYEGKLDLLKQWLASQADPHTSLQIRDKKRNWSPLIYTAASRDHTAVIQWILENGGDVNAVNALGSTALHGACAFGKLNSAKLLAENGANLDHKNKFEETPVELAKLKGFPEIVTLFSADIEWTLSATASAPKKPTRQVVIYDFKGDKELLDRYISFGFYIGLTGAICTPEYAPVFEGFAKDSLPLDKILVLSNSPSSTPANIEDDYIRAQINEPSNVPYIIKQLAKCYQQKEPELHLQVLRNSLEFFGLKLIPITTPEQPL